MTDHDSMSSRDGGRFMSMKSELRKKVRRRLASTLCGSASATCSDSRPCSLASTADVHSLFSVAASASRAREAE
jgi:hypothetical protein